MTNKHTTFLTLALDLVEIMLVQPQTERLLESSELDSARAVVERRDPAAG